MCPIGERHLAARDRAQAGAAGGVGKLERAGQAVVVGQCHRRIAQLRGAQRELIRLGGTVQERVAGVGVQLDHVRCEYQRPRRRSQKTTVCRPPASTRSK